MKKRDFIKTMALGGLSLPLSGITQTLSDKPKMNFTFDGNWDRMREAYQLSSEYINLENGYYNILPKATLEHQIEQLKQLNLEGSHFMRTKMQETRERTRKTLADFLQVPEEELIITRNTTESMDTIISGYPWQKEDNAIMARQEYGSMLDMFKQMNRRFGVIYNLIDLPLHPESDETIVAMYEKAITPKTKMILVSHMINITGQILPIRKICDMAHKYGVKVLVDGAHAVGHFEFKITELNCDYYGASLHKWLSVPLGAGILYVKKENIREIWPLFGEAAYSDDDIRKLNHTGTMPLHIENSIPFAIDFYHAIGGARKEARLRELQLYWTSKARQISGVQINTPAKSHRSCAIANVWKSGYSPAKMAETLMKDYRIWTVAIDAAGVRGCRITPNVYTSFSELDQLVEALKKM
ncbi:MAG: aminotransferase class V-fold PLP-dependent enzyme [Chitinophagaceae bacterium]